MAHRPGGEVTCSMNGACVRMGRDGWMGGVRWGVGVEVCVCMRDGDGVWVQCSIESNRDVTDSLARG